MNKRILLIALGALLAAQLFELLRNGVITAPYLPTLFVTLMHLATAVAAVLIAIALFQRSTIKQISIPENKNLSFLAACLIIVPELIKIAFYLAVSEEAIDKSSPFLWGFDTLFNLLICAQTVGAMIVALGLFKKVENK